MLTIERFGDMMRSALLSAFSILGLAVGLSATHSTPARADLIKLDLLLKACASSSAVARQDCSGYIAGVSDALEENHAICPGGPTLKAVRDMVVGYLQSHKFPGDTHAASAVSEALRAGYPCKKP